MRQLPSLLLLSLLGCSTAPMPRAAVPDGRGAFVAMGALAGDWVAAGAEASTWLSFRLAANGSVLVEEMRQEPAAPPVMMSVYHLDGEALAMSHFCGQGNQPRMRATAVAAGRIRFDVVDVGNLAAPDASRMVRVVFEWHDAQRFTQTWTNRTGEREEAWSFVFTRVPAGGESAAPRSAEPRVATQLPGNGA